MRNKFCLIPLTMCLVVAATIASPLAEAASVSARPSKPTLTRIAATIQSGKIAVKVTFEAAVTNSKSPIIATEVRVGSATCTARGKATACTIRVPASHTYKVTARARNKNGVGSWSASVAFLATAGRVWQRQTTTSTPGSSTATTLPAARIDLSRAKVLGTSSVKLAKVGGISGGAVQSARVRPSAVGDVIFKTSGIVAYAQAESQSQSGSKLLAVSTTGTVSDALASGSAVVKDFYSAPNGNVYVVFETKAPLSTGGTSCLLAVVDTSTGVPTCVDSALDSIKWNLGSSNNGNSPIQFDSSGAVYFAGSVGSSGVLRKAKDGVVTDLLNDNISLQDFIVLSDGVVLVVGQTNSSQVRWLRRISATGGLKNLAIGTVQSFWKFADGKAYAGLWSDPDFGWKRYSAELDALEDKYWISGNINGTSREAFFKLDPQDSIVDCNSSNSSKNYAFCGYYGTIVNPLFNILGQKTFGVAGSSGQNRQLWQYYPTVEKANVSALKNITLAQQVITNLILSGTSSSGTNTLSLYDTSSKQETVVMDGTNEVEIYSMSYSQKKNSILFSGLRFSDNKYVVGEVSLG